VTGAFIYSLAFVAISLILILAVWRVGNLSKTVRWIISILVAIFMLIPAAVVAIQQLLKLLK
jgi:hypothetical protein